MAHRGNQCPDPFYLSSSYIFLDQQQEEFIYRGSNSLLIFWVGNLGWIFGVGVGKQKAVLEAVQNKIIKMKLQTPSRPNFSRYAKLCDQTFYHDSAPVPYVPPSHEPIQVQSPQPKRRSSYGFTSISREKRGNFRFPIRLPHGQFSHYPNHHFGRNRSPSWSFSKRQKYGKEVLVEYQVCEKSPLLHDHDQLRMRASASSLKEAMQDKVRSMRSTSFFTNKEHQEVEMRETKTTRNYSIINARDTSSVGFFNSTKIKKPRYVSKEDLKQAESNLDEQNYQKRAQPKIKGYIQFYQKRARRPNNNSKGFQTVLYPYSHEKQFNNFQMTEHPTHPEGHIDMDKHLDRPDYTPDKLGPNTTPFSIDFSRPSENKINLLLQTFRDKITTRYDRVGPEPNTKLDYDPKPPGLGGMVEMDRDIGRSPQLFPIVDPIIKKAGDKEMTNDLKRHIPVKQINEALRPKNVQNYTKLLAEGI